VRISVTSHATIHLQMVCAPEPTSCYTEDSLHLALPRKENEEEGKRKKKLEAERKKQERIASRGRDGGCGRDGGRS